MTKVIKGKVRRTPASKTVVGQVTRDGRERWRVTTGGHVKTVVTSSSSARAMDEALVVYSKALRRLADR